MKKTDRYKRISPDKFFANGGEMYLFRDEMEYNFVETESGHSIGCTFRPTIIRKLNSKRDFLEAIAEDLTTCVLCYIKGVVWCMNYKRDFCFDDKKILVYLPRETEIEVR